MPKDELSWRPFTREQLKYLSNQELINLAHRYTWQLGNWDFMTLGRDTVIEMLRHKEGIGNTLYVDESTAAAPRSDSVSSNGAAVSLCVRR